MVSRKRTHLEAADEPLQGDSVLAKIRGMWQFANFCQWMYTFGKAAKIDDSIDVEHLEAGCLNPESTLLLDIALALLKLISSHRGLTLDIFDSQARKLYLDQAPDANPFGTDDAPRRFQDFDAATKIRVLQQMTQWIMIYPERIRDKMEEQKDVDQTTWRIEPYGWDSDDRTYFVLDDNRVYRLTEAPPAPPKPKRKKSYYRSGRARSSKRRRAETEQDEQEGNASEAEESMMEPQDDGLGGMKWECLAITLDQVRELVDSFRKTRDENEKVLRKQLEDYLVPILEKQEESRKRKALQRERELLNMAKMANAKRSSRIAGKMEQQKQEEVEKEQAKELRLAEEAARREERARLKIEQEREIRMASREKRLKEREIRRIRHEEELAQLSDDSKRHGDDSSGRGSERRLHAEIQKSRQALKDLEDEDEDWVFDCSCGLYGQVDDGAHSVACEKCNVWQHSKCLGISEGDAEKADFHFICDPCRRRTEELQNAPRSPIRLRINGPSAVAAVNSRPASSGGPSYVPPGGGSVVVGGEEASAADEVLPAGRPGAVSNNSSGSLSGGEGGTSAAGEVPVGPVGSSPQEKPSSPTKGTPTSAKSPLVHLPASTKQLVSPLAPPAGGHDRQYDTAASPVKGHRGYDGAEAVDGSPGKVIPNSNNMEKVRQSGRPDVSKSQGATASLQASLQQGAAGASTNSSDRNTATSGQPQNSASSPVAASLIQTPAGPAPALVSAQNPALEPTLSTPAINRDIYRAAHMENGNIPAQGGISPVKNSPQSSFTSATSFVGSASANNTPAKIPPGITLSPSPREPILTPPTKHSEPARPPQQQQKPQEHQ
ncbi:Chromosome segregation ATPase [Geosmithia morbida]|uniref:Chromosome segregation ATPase n=1 Tax=Geosmithia morbida TaxID=1094350 RepID=A0A9P5D115_9HYPO|nr:Chromosome segregation ATPase [Geosmithia morbida]KAF4123348.1 Chromosome segregation ATPase [Geosmithia morbida]